MKKIYLILILGFVWILHSGAQESIRLTPVAPEGHVANGREYIALASEGLQLELGFDGFFGEYMIFDLVVVNGHGQEVRLDPAGFYYLLLDDPLADSSLLPAFAATNPQIIIHQYESFLGEHESRKRANSFLGVLETSFNVLCSAGAFVATEDPMYIVDGVFTSLGSASHYASANKNIGRDIDLMQEEKEVVSREIMREGSVSPGEASSGFVFFPVFEQEVYLMFCFQLDDQLFQFVYHQEIEDPR